MAFFDSRKAVLKIYNIYMANLSLTRIKKIHSLIKSDRRKFVSLDMLSNKLGIYPDVLGAELSEFYPMILMDTSMNMKYLLPAMEKRMAELEEEKAKTPKKPRLAVSKKEVLEYKSIQSFVYEKMTGAGGLVDTSAVLTDKDLKILQKLVTSEIAKRNPAKRKKTKK